jgi:hypothetical protein
MTTISFEENPGLRKRKFKNISDFFFYLQENDISPLEFKELEESEITPDLKKEMEATKKLPKARFINI